MPKFAFIGDEQETQGFGLVFPRGVPVEVTDPHAVQKLSRNQFYTEVIEGVEVLGEDPPKRRGRPPKER